MKHNTEPELVDLNQIGMPVPVGWRVEQVLTPMPPDGKPRMMVKLVMASPTGISVAFIEGNDAQGLASSLRKAGRAASAGIWASGLEPTWAPEADEEPVRPEGTPEASSARTAQSGQG